jgi:DNA-binding NarL/FixJ family response regulator
MSNPEDLIRRISDGGHESMVLHITPSERTALELLAAGRAAREIARLLGGTERDLEERLAALFSRLGVADRGEAVVAARRRGLIAFPPDARPHLPDTADGSGRRGL